MVILSQRKGHKVNMDVKKLLEAVKNDEIDIDTAITKLKDLPYEDLGYANIDHHREIRNGFP